MSFTTTLDTEQMLDVACKQFIQKVGETIGLDVNKVKTAEQMEKERDYWRSAATRQSETITGMNKRINQLEQDVRAHDNATRKVQTQAKALQAMHECVEKWKKKCADLEALNKDLMNELYNPENVTQRLFGEAETLKVKDERAEGH